MDGGLGDALEELSLGADDYAADLSLDIATPPDAGQTLFAGVETLGEDSDGNLIDADAGDVLHLVQLHLQSSSNGLVYRAPSAVLTPPGFSTADGASSTIAGALAATAPIDLAALEFPRSAWLDLAAASQNPAAQSPSQRLSIEQEKGYLAHGWYSNDSLVEGLSLDIPQDGGTALGDGGVAVEAGALHWASAIAQGWDAFARVESSVEVPFQLSFVDTTLSPPQTVSATRAFTARSAVTAPLDGAGLPASILVPALSAPRAPLLDGVSLFAAQAGTSPTATLSWSAPAVGAPLYYQVVIYQLAPETNADGTFVQDADGNYLLQFTEAASFTTHDLFVSLAADLVEPGQSYFATLAAVDDSGPSGPIDGTLQPYLFGPSSSAALTVTASFTIAGTAAPAARHRARPGRLAPARSLALQRRLWRAPLLRP